ncbi:pyridoxal phosphate-dependent decarboxylase family protein [Aquimarina sp. W85]|uniref:pyridoxal phosphate-dependent decarboxylase family protein n=1 Tax=Aquimarina rhodophyticola TaxID=3342246 RepID=UPI0036702956
MFLETPTVTAPDLEVAHILDNDSINSYKNSLDRTLQYLISFLKKDNFYSGISPKELKATQRSYKVTPEEPISIEQALDQLKACYLDHTISFHHLDYLAHLNCPTVIPSLLGDLIASTVNTAVETWDQSTSATFIEQELMQWICNEMRLPKLSDGVFTSGGTQSNFMALLMARDDYAYKHFGLNLKQNGWSDVVSKFKIFCSEKAHFSIKKNAALLGLGYDSVIPIATDEKMKMSTAALTLAIDKEKKAGNFPIAVVATAGTTDFGSFDPLNAIATIAKKENLWLHVDGAYGGCYILTESHKTVFQGIEQADSITIDFHKTLFQPVCSSAFLVRDKEYFKYVSHFADYLNPIDTRDFDRPNLIEKSIQTTRRFDALKLWFTLKVVGTKTLGGYLERVHFLANEVYSVLDKDTSFECIHQPELSTVVFRYLGPNAGHTVDYDLLNLHIKKVLFDSGRASVASTRVEGKIYLKFTLLNPKSTIEHICGIIRLIKAEGQLYHEDYIKSNNLL